MLPTPDSVLSLADEASESIHYPIGGLIDAARDRLCSSSLRRRRQPRGSNDQLLQPLTYRYLLFQFMIENRRVVRNLIKPCAQPFAAFRAMAWLGTPAQPRNFVIAMLTLRDQAPLVLCAHL